MQQEATHELVGIERHDLMALRAAAAVILVAECHAGLVEGDQAAVRDRNPVCVEREIGEHGLGAGERRLRIDNPSLVPERCEMAQEAASLGKLGLSAEEHELARFVQFDKPGQKQSAEERAQHSNRQEESWTRRYPPPPIKRND